MATAVQCLNNLTEENAEARYQDFYPACSGGILSADDATTTFEQVRRIFQQASSPVMRSYCLLFFGAAIDSGKLSKQAHQQTAALLEALLNNLTDYSVKDAEGRFIHTMSHATYLALSLHEAGCTARVGITAGRLPAGR